MSRPLIHHAGSADGPSGSGSSLFSPERSSCAEFDYERSLESGPAMTAAPTLYDDSKKKKKKKKDRGTIVAIDPASIPKQEFEIADDLSSSVSKKEYSFQRSARRSHIMNLGIGGLNPDLGGDMHANLEVYTKATEGMAMCMYMAVLVGFEALTVPVGFKNCGILPGLFVILFSAFLHVFLAHRLIDIPELSGGNLSGFGDIADVIFRSFGSNFTRFLTVAMWFNGCVLCFFVLIYNLMPVLCYMRVRVNHEFWCYAIEAILMAIFIPQCLKTDAKSLRLNAIWSNRAMYGLLTVVGIASTIHRFLHWSEIKVEWWIPPATERYNSLSQFSIGMKTIGSSMAGLTILPYIVADMMHPQRAKVMVNKAVTRSTCFFIAIGLFGYGGFGQYLKDNILAATIFADDPDRKVKLPYTGFFWWVTQIISLLVSLKCFTTFPLFVWPLFRELNSYLDLDSSPAVAMSLPWAITRLRRMKVYLRLILCAAIFGLRRACPHWRIVEPFAIIPMFFGQWVLLPLFIIIAMGRRLDLIRVRVMGQQLGSQGGSIESSGRRMFGDSYNHLYVAIWMGILSVILGTVLIQQCLFNLHASVSFRWTHPIKHATCECQD